MLLFTVVPLWDARALSRPAPPLVREPVKLPPGLPLGAGWLAVRLPVDCTLLRPAPLLVREPAKLPPGLPLAVGWLAVCLPVDDVPAWPDWGAFDCFGAVFLVCVPVAPGRGVEASNAPPLGTVLPAVPGRELLGCLEADVPGCPCGAA